MCPAASPAEEPRPQQGWQKKGCAMRSAAPRPAEQEATVPPRGTAGTCRQLQHIPGLGSIDGKTVLHARDVHPIRPTGFTPHRCKLLSMMVKSSQLYFFLFPGCKLLFVLLRYYLKDTPRSIPLLGTVYKGTKAASLCLSRSEISISKLG